MNYIKWILSITFTSLVFLLATALLSLLLMPPTTHFIEKPIINDNIALHAWMGKLAHCESGHRTYIRIVDSNGKFSTGLFQWQNDSVEHYNRLYNLYDLEKAEIENVIYDRDFQWDFTEQVLTRDPLAWRNWTNCVKKIGKPPQITP